MGQPNATRTAQTRRFTLRSDVTGGVKRTRVKRTSEGGGGTAMYLLGVWRNPVGGLLASEHRTADPEEADYFFMPMVGGAKPISREELPDGLMPWARTGNRLDGLRYIKKHPAWGRWI